MTLIGVKSLLSGHRVFLSNRTGSTDLPRTRKSPVKTRLTEHLYFLLYVLVFLTGDRGETGRSLTEEKEGSSVENREGK